MPDTRTRVAVCDDARAVKLFLAHVLEEEGDMQVVSCTGSGGELLDDLADRTADVLLLDLLLPDVPEPAELVRLLRERAPAMAIVLISNLAPFRLEEEAGRLGTDAWLPKAHKPAELRETIRRAVAARHGV